MQNIKSLKCVLVGDYEIGTPTGEITLENYSYMLPVEGKIVSLELKLAASSLRPSAPHDLPPNGRVPHLLFHHFSFFLRQREEQVASRNPTPRPWRAIGLGGNEVRSP